jgi:hypothetical protein
MQPAFSGSTYQLENDSVFRHGRASSRPSTSFLLDAAKTWMPGTRAGHDELLLKAPFHWLLFESDSEEHRAAMRLEG